jgi:23S rRNA (adenine2503-C2)-methyltransferase
MPINKRESLIKVLSETEDYIEKTRRRVMFEYVLIDGVNDSDKQAEELAELLSGISLCFVNLITYNPTKVFLPSEQKRVEIFKRILNRAKISAISRFRFGDDIDAACGQLAGK